MEMGQWFMGQMVTIFEWVTWVMGSDEITAQ